ncbi:MAG: hypothetical protein ACJ76Y_11990 [Thermoanaerobaculia bacterium]
MRLQLPSVLLLLGLAVPATGAQAPQVANARIETASAAGGLEAAVRQAGARAGEPFWIAWSVPMIEGQRYPAAFAYVEKALGE